MAHIDFIVEENLVEENRKAIRKHFKTQVMKELLFFTHEVRYGSWRKCRYFPSCDQKVPRILRTNGCNALRRICPHWCIVCDCTYRHYQPIFNQTRIMATGFKNGATKYWLDVYGLQNTHSFYGCEGRNRCEQ